MVRFAADPHRRIRAIAARDATDAVLLVTLLGDACPEVAGAAAGNSALEVSVVEQVANDSGASNRVTSPDPS